MKPLEQITKDLAEHLVYKKQARYIKVEEQKSYLVYKGNIYYFKNDVYTNVNKYRGEK